MYEPAILKVVQYVQEVKKCKACGGKGSVHPSDVFVQAKVPRPVLMHSLASASLVAGVMYKKYDMGIPLARQERDWMRLGLETYRSTLANWVIRSSEEWLTPVYNRMHRKMLESEILQGDADPMQPRARQKSRQRIVYAGDADREYGTDTGDDIPLCQNAIRRRSEDIV